MTFYFSSSFTKNYERPWRVSFDSWLMKSWNGFFINMAHISFDFSDRVAENIITYLLLAFPFMKIFCTYCLMSASISILSHSSRMKNLRSLSFKCPWLTNWRTLPGVPITICGDSLPSRTAISSLIGTPPKKTCDLTWGICLVKRFTSFLIWYASSLTLHRIRAVFGFGSSSICCRIEIIKTAVLPIPDTAWHKTSLPWTDWGMHSYWTSDGCSKPQS